MLDMKISKEGNQNLNRLTELMRQFPEHAQRGSTAALYSEGKRMKGVMQESVKDGPSVLGWPPLQPVFIKKATKKKGGGKADHKRRRVNSKRRNPLTSLTRTVRFFVNKPAKKVDIGFLSGRIMGLYRMHAKGYTIRVNDRMRRLFGALGYGIKGSTTSFNVPARALIEPVYKKEKQNIDKKLAEAFEKKVANYFLEGVRRKAGKK